MTTNLHAYWDGLLGVYATPQIAIADALINPATKLPDPDPNLASVADPAVWVAEGKTLAQDVVYAEPVRSGPRPYMLDRQYETNARMIARQRASLGWGPPGQPHQRGAEVVGRSRKHCGKFGDSAEVHPWVHGPSRLARPDGSDSVSHAEVGAALGERMAVVFEGELFADYHQFYLEDDAGKPDIPADWTDEAVRHRILCADGVVSVSTARNMTVPVRVELHDEPPQVPGKPTTSSWPTCALPAGWSSQVARITCRMRPASPSPKATCGPWWCSPGSARSREDGLEGGDRYTIHLWPGRGNGTTVLRQWEGD